MRINVDRLRVLAGLGEPAKAGTLNEASNRSYHDDPALSDEAEFRFGKNQLNEKKKKKDDEDEDEDMDEVIEVDEQMLVQELRRAKKLMAESTRRKKKDSLMEAELKSIIDEEVKNVMRDLNLNSGWVYGKKRPRNSKRGYVNTAFPGIGFK